MRQLPARQRMAIVLRYYLDLPEAEVARLRDRLGPIYAEERLAGNANPEAGA